MTDTVVAWVFWLFIGSTVWLYWYTGPTENEIFEYRGICTNDVELTPLALAERAGLTYQEMDEARAQCSAVAYGRTQYVVNVAQGKVASRVVGTPMITEFTNCTIMDARNWRCEFSDGSGQVGFLDGFRTMFTEDVGDIADVFYVRRWQFILLRWIGPTHSRWLVPEQKVQV